MDNQIANLNIYNDESEINGINLFITCTYCAITFQTRADLRHHCQTEIHQNVIMSDEGMNFSH